MSVMHKHLVIDQSSSNKLHGIYCLIVLGTHFGFRKCSSLLISTCLNLRDHHCKEGCEWVWA